MKKAILAILLFFTCLTAKSQLLYQISGRGVEKSYLFATNKYVNIDFLDSVPNLLPVFARCQTVVTEFAITDSTLAPLLSAAAMLPDTVDLYTLYSPVEITAINNALTDYMQISVNQIARMRPCYITQIFRDALMQRNLQYTPDRSSEIFFQAMAEPYGKRVVALDSPTETLYMMFEREPRHWQQKELVDIALYPERDIRLEKEILNLYRNGHLTQIAYNLQAPDNNSTLSYSDYQVFAQRNRQWVKRLEPLLAEGKLFICLDAKFLGGDNGLIALLRAAGYKVKPVNK